MKLKGKSPHSLNTCTSKNTTVNYLISAQKPTDRISYPPIFENFIYAFDLTLGCENLYNYVQANVHLLSILYSTATRKKKGKGVKQLMAPGMKKIYGKEPRSHLSHCCAKNILTNTLKRKADHRMISFHAQNMTDFTCSEVCLLF